MASQTKEGTRSAYADPQFTEQVAALNALFADGPLLKWFGLNEEQKRLVKTMERFGLVRHVRFVSLRRTGKDTPGEVGAEKRVFHTFIDPEFHKGTYYFLPASLSEAERELANKIIVTIPSQSNGNAGAVRALRLIFTNAGFTEAESREIITMKRELDASALQRAD